MYLWREQAFSIQKVGETANGSLEGRQLLGSKVEPAEHAQLILLKFVN